MSAGRVLFAWGASSWYGWGVIGLNLMLHWEGEALCAVGDLAAELAPDDGRWNLLRERQEVSARWMQRMMADPGLRYYGVIDDPLFVAMGNDFEPSPALPIRPLCGRPSVAFPVFEDLTVAGCCVEKLLPYPLVFAASEWNRDFLVDRGIDARLWHQGYDPVYFHPGVRWARSDGRFRVFSGGKAEWRKGQDIVLQAFARFAARHDDAVLVAQWGSPWPRAALTFGDTAVGVPPGAEIGMPNYRAWAQRAGIAPYQFELVPALPNWRMPEVYGGVDVALFPNRAEGGTNLVAMEAMACGVPAIIECVAGQRDIAAYAVQAAETGGDVDYYVEQLETSYRSVPFAEPLGAEWAWPARVAELRDILEG